MQMIVYGKRINSTNFYFDDFKENLEKHESNRLSGLIIKAFHDLNIMSNKRIINKVKNSKKYFIQ